MKKLEKVTFERFSFKKYQKYQQQGLPIRLITGGGVEVHIIAEHVGVNKDLFLVETETLYYNDTNLPYVNWFAIKPNGMHNGSIGSDTKNRVYIQLGCIDIQEGDIIILQASNDSGFYFMYMLDKICCLDDKGKPGFCVKHGVDMYGGQYHTNVFQDTDYHECYMRVATPEEEGKYWKMLEDNGMRLNTDKTNLKFYPMIGQPYWTIELECGEYKVVAHDAPTCQEERPIRDLCFSSEEAAQCKVDELKRPRW